MSRTTSRYVFFCRHCGRTWNTEGRTRSHLRARQGKSNATGFIASAAGNHEYACGLKTPAERRETNRRDEARWLKRPPQASRILNDPSHPGLRDQLGPAESSAHSPSEASATSVTRDEPPLTPPGGG